MLMYPKNSAVASLRCLFFLYVHRYFVVSRNCSKISHSKILMCKKMTKNYEVGTLYSKNCTIVKKLTWYKNLIAFLPADWYFFVIPKADNQLGKKARKFKLYDLLRLSMMGSMVAISPLLWYLELPLLCSK